MVSTGRIRIGIVGAGGYGRSARGNLRHVDEFEIVACMDVDPEIAAEAAEEEQAEPVASLEELLAFPGLDAVSINTPIPLHAGQSLQSLAAGKHVLVTKPVARTVADALAVMESASDRKLACMVGHHARFAPPMLKMKQEMESGALGRICNVLVTCCSSSGLEQKEGDWRAEPGANPGGPLLHCGIHLIDILLSFFGEVATVSAIMQEDVTSYEAIDNTLTLLHFKNGVQAAFVCNYTTAYMHTFDVFGTKGNLHHHQHITDLKQHELYFQPRKNGPHEPWEELEIPQDKDPAQQRGCALEAEFARQIRTRDHDYQNMEQAIDALRIVEAAVESHRSGRQARV